MKLSDRLKSAGEPHGSLQAFLCDLYEQCEMFKATARDPMVQSILHYVQASLTMGGIVIGVDLERREKNKK
jgi:hypothetical protein